MGQQREKTNRSQQILATAKAVFAQSNYRSSTTAEIAAAAGISEPLIYRYYPSKKHLYLAVLGDVAQRILQRWDAIRRTETSSLACLHRIGRDYLDLLDRNSDDLKVFFKAVCEDGDPEIRDFLAESYRSYARYLEDVARQGQERGEIRRDIPARVIAWQMMSLGAAFNLFAVLGLSEWTRADRETQLLAFLERIATSHVATLLTREAAGPDPASATGRGAGRAAIPRPGTAIGQDVDPAANLPTGNAAGATRGEGVGMPREPAAETAGPAGPPDGGVAGERTAQSDR
ncbi:transcriptional regulator, TetR family [Thermaerobacter marianensis DSM 12885]|uniref:Transcriptional regulator, TetR family n=1 Tax=Thermaerobacter marianensis (strain ATCC 700841 / DSM 12885 / JCM 10246 / 7p75a) TaxID=644966 RepID=E6SIE2_THEM7|nr:TetR/AcrR family transcriptional regulator [Thermaerobacter marianensis]ADU51953.1 transcriptional regulator, TetR family [Thermaerobacter marianensis DSM 12885]